MALEPLDPPEIARPRKFAEPGEGQGSCPDCGGSGWALEPDGGAGLAQPCDCRKRTLGDRLLDAAGIPPIYSECTLDSFDSSHPDKAARDQLLQARRASERYVDDFLRPGGGFATRGLLYIGITGAGKTHLATAVLKELIRRYRVHGRYVEFTDLVLRIQSTFDPSSQLTKAGLLDPLMRAEVLVLDELGAKKPTEWVLDLLYVIINHRYTHRLPTLFTTNHPLDASPLQGAAAGGGGHGFEDGDVATDQGFEDRDVKGASPGPAGSGASKRSSAGVRSAGGQRPGQGMRTEPLVHRLGANLVSRLHQMAKPVLLDAVTDHRAEVESSTFR